MRERLLAMWAKLLLSQGDFIKKVKKLLINRLVTKPFHHRHSLNILIFLMIGLVASSFIAKHATSSVFPEIPYRTSWIGNTFSGGDKWVQIGIAAMFVAPEGTVYTNSVWDEAGREAGIYKDGDVIGKLSTTHGWGRTGGIAITANRQYIYMAMQQESPDKMVLQDYPPPQTTWYCVRRYNLSGEPAPFSRGRGYDKSMLIVSTSSPVTGLAEYKDELYVSDWAASRIRVYDSDRMKELRSWAFDRPGQIAVDRQGNLWIIQVEDTKNPPQVLHYSPQGKLLPEVIANVVEPTALAVDNQGRLLVAENGPSQQILIYKVTEEGAQRTAPLIVGTVGKKGGIYSDTKGEVEDLKFYGLTGVGTDASGNIYVSNSGFNRAGTDLRKLSPQGKLHWQLLGLEFVDNADADPGTDGRDVFTKEEHFVLDYSKSNGQEWIYKASTLDKFRYPEDPRLHNLNHSVTSVFVRRIGSKRFLYLTGMYAEHLMVYRFEGEIAVPSAIFARKHSDWPTNQPTSGSWLWRDLNGDGSIQTNEYESLGAEDNAIWGWEVDSKGDVWQASASGYIRHFRALGLDTHGSPIYTDAASETMPMPAVFKSIERIKYFPDTDVMYLGGYTDQRPQSGEEWGIVGTEIVRYDNWSKTRKMRWRISLPYDPKADPILIIKAMDVAGDKVFVVDSRKAEVYVYDAVTGAVVTKLSPGPEVAYESGWTDIPYALRAYQRVNGEYVVFVEEDAKAKVLMYRLKP